MADILPFSSDDAPEQVRVPTLAERKAAAEAARGLGLVCPHCRMNNASVDYKRDKPGFVLRKHTCRFCAGIFWTRQTIFTSKPPEADTNGSNGHRRAA